ncbi:MAG: M1 family metallopeptidase [Bacteroidetes bacterium]|nr:M1 family metallopeptidase [Bacteroidota bacterium]
MYFIHMRQLLTLVTILLIIPSAKSQNYWQQKVDYTINVALDDTKHTLKGSVKMIYHNQSPENLDKIYIHLWPNAYRSDQSSLGKQIYQSGNQLLKYGEDSIKGNISEIDFKVNDLAATWNLDPAHEDIAIIQLTNPLKSGEKVTISTPFSVKIPSGEISRLGHVGQSYQITQWYPKPAVYDKNGWHPIPYLNQGEFYSEFGSYDVYITLPENYIIGATGDLQNQKEISFLNEKANNDKINLELLSSDSKNVNAFPPSSDQTKTLHYKQQNVHDFAWFADKRFLVLKDSVELPASKKMVTTWAMFTPRNKALWKNSSEYLKDAIYYYSLWNGDYPYQQVTAVDGTISAGGGMEYPNVTVIGNASNAEQLEVVIVHEVGHNWFYGILGTNEREHGWMDEGLNTLNEIRYIQTKYKGNKRLSDMVLGGKFHLNDLDYHDQADLQHQLIARLGEDQPIETPSSDFTSANYGIVMYQKTGLVFHYLKYYLGDSLFDVCMNAYFETWKFKHPQPEDLKAIFEAKTGENLDWMFGDLIQTRKKIDFKIKSVKRTKTGTEVTVKNSGQVVGPVPVTSYGTDTTTHWIKLNEKGIGSVIIENSFNILQIDPENNLPEINRSNNTWMRNKLFHRLEPLSLEFLIGDNEPKKSNLFWAPIAAYNEADQMMLGTIIHNYGFPLKPVQFYITPMYSFGRNFISGQGEINYTYLPEKMAGQIQFGLQGRTYKLEESNRGNSNYYAAITPFFQRKFCNPKFKPHWEADWMTKALYRADRFASKNEESIGAMTRLDVFYSGPDHEINFDIKHEFVTRSVSKDLVHRSQASATYRYRYAKNKMTRWVELRVYGGKVLQIKQTEPLQNSFALAVAGANGNQDLFFEEISFNRSPYQGLQSTVRQENMGGFKSTSELSSNNWLTAANLYLELPIPKINIGLFGDYAFSPSPTSSSTLINYWDLGLGLRFKKILRIYFPIMESSNIQSSLVPLTYPQKIRFSLQWNILHRSIRLSNLL